MAVTFNGFTLAFNQNIDLYLAEAAPDATALANGGLAALGNHSGHIDGTIFNSVGIQTAVWTAPMGTNGSIAQTAIGGLSILVIASQDTDSILYEIRDSVFGNTVLSTVDIGDLDCSNASVAALTGGNFVIVNQDENGAVGGDADIDVRIYNGTGGLNISFSVDLSGDRDLDPSVAALSNGNFVVSWTRVIGAETEIWYAIYNSAGGVVKAPTLLDTTGTVNQNSDLVATAGGFAMVYEDNGWDGDTDITLAQFDVNGNLQQSDNVANDGAGGNNDEAPSVTQVSNGALAVTYGDNTGGSDTDTILALINAADGSVITTANVTAGSSIVDDVTDSVVTGYGTGQIAVFQTNVSTGTVDGAVYEIQNNYTGDGANDVFVATGYRDFIQGGGGDDQLFGVGGNDFLSGGDGNDILSGGNGNDTANGGNGTDTLYGAAGNDSLFGGAGVDTMLGGSGNDTVSGGAQGDSLFGQAGIDSLNGGAGNDTLSGGDDGDQLYGGVNADQLIGGNGDDFLDGGTGNDTMTGGNGADIFYFSDGYQADAAQGFTNDVDTLQLDDTLWVGVLSVAQVIATFATQTSPGIVTFDFGGGDILTVINGAGITTAQLVDDITIV